MLKNQASAEELCSCREKPGKLPLSSAGALCFREPESAAQTVRLGDGGIWQHPL